MSVALPQELASVVKEFVLSSCNLWIAAFVGERERRLDLAFEAPPMRVINA